MPHLLSLTFLSPLSLSSVLWVTIIFEVVFPDTHQPALLWDLAVLPFHSEAGTQGRVGQTALFYSRILGVYLGHVVTPLRVFLSLESQAGFSVPSQDHFCLPSWLLLFNRGHLCTVLGMETLLWLVYSSIVFTWAFLPSMGTGIGKVKSRNRSFLSLSNCVSHRTWVSEWNLGWLYGQRATG